MSRRNRSRGPKVSLFPFLSILACVIGVLTLMISLLSLLQVDPEEINALERAEQAESLRLVVDSRQAEFDERQQNVDELRRKMAEAKAFAQSLESAKAELAKLQSDFDANRKLSDQKKNMIVSLLAEIQQLREIVAQAKKDLKALGVDISNLEERIKSIKPAEVVNKVLPPGEGGGGRGGRSKFLFIDIRDDEVRVYEAKREPISIDITRNAKNRLEELNDTFERVYQSKNSLRVVQFIRRSEKSAESAWWIEQLAKGKGVLIGKLPAVDDGPLDLSEFGIPREQTGIR